MIVVGRLGVGYQNGIERVVRGEKDKNISGPPSGRVEEREAGADSAPRLPIAPQRPADQAAQDHISTAVRPTEPRPPLSVPPIPRSSRVDKPR
jgi:hypothetical protein